MAFTIESISSDGAWVPLSRDTNKIDSNVFSLIVGRNATGKSRLLRKIVSNYIFDQDARDLGQVKYLRSWHDEPSTYHESLLSDIILSPISNPQPTKVIAVSTGRHDRFPRPRQASSRGNNYQYIAPSEHGGPLSLSRSLASIIGGLERVVSKYSDLRDILRYLDFEPILEFKISIDPKYKIHTKSLDESQTRINWSESDEDNRFRATKEYRAIKHLQHMLNYVDSRSGINCEIDLNHGMRTHGAISTEEIIEGLDAGIVRVTELTLYTRSTKNKVKMSQASSGQQCMLTMILGIAGSIQDDSLICIDEPEISLHPEWQTDIIGQLQKAFSGYRGCHFIIATHSPQIVAGLTIKNGFVLDLEGRQLHRSRDYSNRSADFQLAQIFNAPGINNEYLIRISLSILSKITKRQEMTPQDLDNISMLAEMKESLSDLDPVRHLVDQILALR